MSAVKKKSLTLKEWIEKEGIPTVAKALRVEVSAVRHWRRGYVLPRAEQMLTIKKLSNGAVTFDSMIEGHFSSKNKNRYGK